MSNCADIRTLAKHILDLTMVIDKMGKDIESLKETQKHLQEVMPMIKQMDKGEKVKCPTCNGRGFTADNKNSDCPDYFECWRCGGHGVL